MVFRLVTLGDLRLTGADGKTVAYPEKALIALCYLLTSKSTERSRSDVAQFLWGDVEPSRASANLRTLLFRVKAQQAEIGTELLVIRDASLAAAGPRDLECDMLLVEAPADPAASVRALLDLCQGPFLAGVEEFSERGRDWLALQRERLLGQMADAVETLAASAESSDRELAKEGAYRLLQIDPQCEQAYRALMKVHGAGGQLHAVRATYERLREHLWHELGVGPDPSTILLLRDLSSPPAMPAQPVQAAAAATGSIPSQNARSLLPRVALLPPLTREHSMLPALIEDVTLGLCAFKTIALIAPHTAAQIAAETDRAAAYERHAIAYVLDTRISAATDSEALFAQLIDVRGDSVIWTERYDGRRGALPQQYAAIARRIAASIAGRIEENELQALGCEMHPNAYHYYLMGQRFLKRIDLPDIRRARKAFRLSLREDPGFAPSYAGLSRTDHMEWLLTARGDDTLLNSAETNAASAIERLRESSNGYRELGVTMLFKHRFDDSIEAFERAEASSPCHADMIADYADTLVHASDPVRGLAKIEQAIHLNPLAPDVYHWTAAGANYFLGRYGAALDSLARMEDQSHNSRLAAACWGMLGDRKKAQAHRRKTMANHPDFDIETWLAIAPIREKWQKDQYREGLRKAGFT